MKVVTGAQMRAIDKMTIEEYGLPGIVLMERAAGAVTGLVIRRLREKGWKRVLILCGKGNNGGDGFAVGRQLFAAGYAPRLVFAGNPGELTGDTLANFRRAGDLSLVEMLDPRSLFESIREADIVVDGLLGTGIRGGAREPYRSVIEAVNAGARYTISIDIPSGLDADGAKQSGPVIKARETVTLALPKLGLLTGDGPAFCGKTHVADIGIPKAVIDKADSLIQTLRTEEIRTLLPSRKPRSNKGTYGKVVVFAGNREMAGAAYLAAKSAYRAGAGLVYCLIPRDIASVLQTLIPEAIVLPRETSDPTDFGEKARGFLREAKTLLIGPGLGESPAIRTMIFELLRDFEGNILLDADGLNNIREHPEILRACKKTPLITPHPGEMARLCGKSVGEILKDPLTVAREFSRACRCITLLKDHRTVIATPEGSVWLNGTGSTALSKGGSGDVLTGLIGGLAAQGMDLAEAAVVGAFVHGKAGERIGRRMSEYAPLAGEISDEIPEILKMLGEDPA